MPYPAILHCDLNNFYASCECALNPALRDVPLAVCGDPERRHGIVLAKNALAKQCGVKTAEPIWQAKQKCPDLITVPPQFDLYFEYSRRVQAIYLEYTDLVESFGLDECWLDVTASKLLFGDAVHIANEIRNRVKREVGLTISVGVAHTKTLAKLGSDMKKPDATTVITPENMAETVWRLPASEMIFVGEQTAKRLHKLNIFTLGDLARADEALLSKHFGVMGARLKNAALGNESDRVKSYYEKREIKSVGHGVTLSQDIKTLGEAHLTVQGLSEMIASRLRRYGYLAGGVQVHLRDHSLQCVSKQKQISPTDTATEIATAAEELFSQLFHAENPIRTLTVNTFALTATDIPRQQSMFDTPQSEKHRRLGSVVDAIRKKHGNESIERGVLLKNSFISDHSSDEDDLLPFKRN